MTNAEKIRRMTNGKLEKWLKNMIHGYEKLCEYSGYNCMTEPDLKTDEEENNDDKRAF